MKRKEGLKLQQIIFCILVVVLLAIISLDIMVTYGFKAEEEEVCSHRKNNTFLVCNGDEYDVYVDRVYFFSTDDLSPFRNVNIYDSLEEALEKEKENTE